MKNKIRSNLKATAFNAINFMVIANFIALNNTNAATTTYILSRTTTTTDFKLLLINLLRWLLSVIGNIALIMFIIGGIMYMTSAGDPQKASSAKKIVLMTSVGLMLALLSYSILELLNHILT